MGHEHFGVKSMVLPFKSGKCTYISLFVCVLGYMAALHFWKAVTSPTL